MGLSEREQQMLDDMEKLLYQSEADVMQTAPSQARLNLRSLVLGILVILAGVGALIAGVGVQQFWIGMIGFVLMLAGTLLAFSKREAVDHAGAAKTSDSKGQQTRAKETFGDRMNKRWNERMDGER